MSSTRIQTPDVLPEDVWKWQSVAPGGTAARGFSVPLDQRAAPSCAADIRGRTDAASAVTADLRVSDADVTASSHLF